VRKWFRHLPDAKQLKTKLKAVPIEAMGLLSIILIARGIWLIYMPAAIIFLGIACGLPYILRTLESLRGDKQ
jgi:hypothetical protein